MSRTTQKIILLGIITLLTGTMMFSINNATAYNEVGNQSPQSFDFASDATTEAIAINWDSSNDLFLEASVIVNPPDGYTIISTEIYITINGGEAPDDSANDDADVWGFDPHTTDLFQVEIGGEINAHFDEVEHLSDVHYLVQIDEQEAGDIYKIRVKSKFGKGDVHITKEDEAESVVLIEGMMVGLDGVDYFTWEDAESDYPEKIHIPEKAGDPYIIKDLENTEIRLQNAENFRIQDCFVTSWARVNSFISIGGCSNGIVSLPEVDDEVTVGILIKDSSDIEINDGSINGANKGIKIYGSNNILVSNMEIIGDDDFAMISAIDITDSVKVGVNGNDIENGKTALSISGSVQGSYKANTMVDLEVSITLSPGFTYENSKQNTIADNLITRSELAIELQDSDENTIKGNTIVESERGIVLHTMSDTNIVDNNVFETTTLPIQIAATSSYNIISNNDIIGGIRGIYISSRSSYNQIIGNTITDTIQEGIYLKDRCEGNIIEGNTIQSSEVYGIRLWDRCDENEIIDNLVEDTGKWLSYGWVGFSVKIERYSESNVIEGNVIIGKFSSSEGGIKPYTPYGIHISGHSNYATITNNKVEKHAIGNLLIITSGHTEVSENGFSYIGRELWNGNPPAHIIQWGISSYQDTNQFSHNYYDNYYGLSDPTTYDPDGDGIAGYMDDSGVYHHFPYINWTYYRVKDDYPLMREPIGIVKKIALYKIEDLTDAVLELDQNSWDKNPEQRRKAMSNKLKATYVMIEDQDWDTVKSKMLGDIRPKLAGVKADGSDWKNSWIVGDELKTEMLSKCDYIIELMDAILFS